MQRLLSCTFLSLHCPLHQQMRKTIPLRRLLLVLSCLLDFPREKETFARRTVACIPFCIVRHHFLACLEQVEHLPRSSSCIEIGDLAQLAEVFHRLSSKFQHMLTISYAYKLFQKLLQKRWNLCMIPKCAGLGLYSIYVNKIKIEEGRCRIFQ